MTINKLRKILDQAVKDGYGHRRVCVYKTSFQHPLEGDGCVIMDAKNAMVKSVNLINDDGGTKTDSKGRECYFTALVITGGDEPEESQ